MEEKEILEAFGSVYDYLNDKTIYELRSIAREFGVKAPSSEKKHQLILRIIIAAAGIGEPETVSRRGARVKAGAAPAESIAEVRKLTQECRAHLPYESYIPESERIEFNDVIRSAPVYGYGDKAYRGYLQKTLDGGWRMYPEREVSSVKIPVVSEEVVAKYSLREGDFVVGYVVEAAGKPPVFAQAEFVNNKPCGYARPVFEEFTASYPAEKFTLSSSKNACVRAAGLVCPLGKGQRALVVAPSGTGKTTLLQEIAKCTAGEAKVILLLLGQRPEESAESRANLPGALVLSAPFDSSYEEQAQLARLALECGKRIAEEGGNALLLLDSMPAYVRAAEKTAADAESAKLDCRKFFASARKLDGGGSLTVLATTDETGAEEFISASNSVLYLAREYTAFGIPAVDLLRSGTKRAETLLNEREQEAVRQLRRTAAEKGMAAAFALAETFTI